MPFVQRDAEGRIVGVFAVAIAEELEEIDVKDAELAAFLANSGVGGGMTGGWIESDLAMARVIEDIIDLLIDRNVIRFDELPTAAREKIIRRRGLRSDLSYAATLLADAELAGDDGGAAVEDGEKYL